MQGEGPIAGPILPQEVVDGAELRLEGPDRLPGDDEAPKTIYVPPKTSA